MKEKYDPRYEDQIAKLTQDNLLNKKYKVFDAKARAVIRRRIVGLIEEGNEKESTCLVLTNRIDQYIDLNFSFPIRWHLPFRYEREFVNRAHHSCWSP